MKSKKVGEIFSDYKTNSNIKYAEVRALNVIKKTNTLQVLLYFDEYIEIKEIWYFEKFLREKFMFLSVDIKIEYYEAVEKKDIKTEWRNIIAYMAHKYPLTKPMLLLKSDIDVVEKNIIVRMHIKGADFLKAKKTDKELAKVLKNLFGIEYTIELRIIVIDTQYSLLHNSSKDITCIKTREKYMIQLYFEYIYLNLF